MRLETFGGLDGTDGVSWISSISALLRKHHPHWFNHQNWKHTRTKGLGERQHGNTSTRSVLHFKRGKNTAVLKSSPESTNTFIQTLQRKPPQISRWLRSRVNWLAFSGRRCKPLLKQPKQPDSINSSWRKSPKQRWRAQVYTFR